MFLLYLFVCNCTCECMFCVGDHLVQAVLPFVLPIFGKIDNNNNNNNNNELDDHIVQASTLDLFNNHINFYKCPFIFADSEKCRFGDSMSA